MNQNVYQYTYDYEYEYSADWFSKNTARWSQLFSHVVQGARKLLEIGSYEGRSAVWLLENILQANGGEIYCVDTWEGGEEHNKAAMAEVERRFDRNTALALQKSAKSKLVKRKGPSRAILAQLNAEGHAGSFEFIYVDGSHQAPDVLEDLVGAFALCRIGGVIACDDYLWEFGKNPLHTPKLAIDAFVNCYAGKITVVPAPLYQIYLVKKSD